MEYEYVNKSEYRPMREELEQIINRVHKYMRKHHDTTFQHRLIGSGKRHLITRIKGGNTGYDFDYNLIVEAPICCLLNVSVKNTSCGIEFLEQILRCGLFRACFYGFLCALALLIRRCQ